MWISRPASLCWVFWYILTRAVSFNETQFILITSLLCMDRQYQHTFQLLNSLRHVKKVILNVYTLLLNCWYFKTFHGVIWYDHVPLWFMTSCISLEPSIHTADVTKCISISLIQFYSLFYMFWVYVNCIYSFSAKTCRVNDDEFHKLETCSTMQKTELVMY